MKESEEDYKTILYEIVSDNLTNMVNGIKIPIDVKLKFKGASMRS